MSIIHTDTPPLFYKPVNNLVTSPCPPVLSKRLSLVLKAALITGGLLASSYAIGTILIFPTPLTSFIGKSAAQALSFVIWSHQLFLTKGVWSEIGKLVGQRRREDSPEVIAGKLLFKAATILPCFIGWIESSQLLCSGNTLFVSSSLILPILPIPVLLGTYYYLQEIDLLSLPTVSESAEIV